MKNNETEVIIYARIGNVTGLSSADVVESQQQYETKYSNGIPCRIRTIDNRNPVYTLKIRDEKSKLAKAEEYHQHVTQEFLEGFKYAADHWLNKRRLIFHSNNVTMGAVIDGVAKAIVLPSVDYEVDLYYKSDGTLSPWCKIELEVDKLLEHVKEYSNKPVNLKLSVSTLPFEPMDIILMPNATEDQKAFVNNLWEKEFRLPIQK